MITKCRIQKIIAIPVLLFALGGCGESQESEKLLDAFLVRRHIVGGANRTLISVETPVRLCHIGTYRRLSAG